MCAIRATSAVPHTYPAYKPSGVQWLGDVPTHWEAQRLRSLANIKTGGRDTVNRRDDGEYPFFVRSQTIERIDTWSFDGEAVLTAGDGVGVGKVFHYINGKFHYHQCVYKFSDFRDVLGKFFFHYPYEQRWKTTGMAGQTVLIVIHTWREGGPETGRIISARKATRTERSDYEEGYARTY